MDRKPQSTSDEGSGEWIVPPKASPQFSSASLFSSALLSALIGNIHFYMGWQKPQQKAANEMASAIPEESMTLPAFLFVFQPRVPVFVTYVTRRFQ
jgi:hypothetical protein